ncbi:primosomal protein N' [Nocardioides aurantiacus]|uniref:Probable replication restart protein PriA n=1 Tax=Nocardioides aurantiacus TaxID=86796 RepID=A0A3N2CVJ0_9ACTN|nr:primosomal protein N' [Nocardioides aurantiacus]ROR91244.1 replication restart DNA helicase PriA [Nocardioides aurantiacus]
MTDPSPPPDPAEEQLALLPAPARVREVVRRTKPPQERTPDPVAEVDPVARVLVDVPLAHLDRPFDYAVPAPLAASAQPGVRVKVRFAGQDVDGFVLERAATTTHTGRLQPLRRVVSAEPVLLPEVAALTGDVAARYAGTRSDVLRLAVPARHASVEKEPPREAAPVPDAPEPRAWSAYAGGADLVAGLAAAESPRAVWTVLPGDDGAALLADAAVATAASGRGALVCVPDRRDLDRLDAALTARLGAGGHVVLAADAGPAKRYRAFLAVSRGAVPIVVGTRAAAFAPVRDLGLVAIWDDGDDLHDEPRAPYPHAREVLLLRAQATGCAAVLASHARSVEAEYLLRTGWAREVAAPRETVRERIAVDVAGADPLAESRDPGARTRLPSQALRLLREAVADGPVLVQAPRVGYATRLVCERCFTSATCTVCRGPLRQRGPGRPLECAWCATAAPGWRCEECGHAGLRAPVLGDARTAEEIGRALPGVAVRQSSSGERVLDQVSSAPAVVVATPGAEPPAEGGYAAVLLLDTWLLLGRADLRATEEAVRRWANAAALVRPASEGGRVMAVGDPAHPGLQALVRWDPGGLARREIDERHSAHLPPASRVATLTGTAADLEQGLAALELPPGAEVLGPVPVPPPRDSTADVDQERYVLRVPRSGGAALSRALQDLQARRSTRKLPHLRVEVDPAELG